MHSDDIRLRIINKAKELGWQIATAESCTGGMVATRLTDPAGSSTAIAGGFVTYSNHMKRTLLNVPSSCLETYGAVSDETVSAMAQGCLEKTGAQLAVSISGVAGPGGGSDAKPVGTVHFGLLAEGENHAQCSKVIFDGAREDVREQAADFALHLLADKLEAALSLQGQHGENS